MPGHHRLRYLLRNESGGVRRAADRLCGSAIGGNQQLPVTIAVLLLRTCRGAVRRILREELTTEAIEPSLDFIQRRRSPRRVRRRTPGQPAKERGRQAETAVSTTTAIRTD